MINIRIATSSDISAIFSLVNELAIYEKAADAVTTSIESYNRDFEAKIFEAIVAEKDGEVVGMVLYYMAYSTWKGKMLYLEDFVVKDEFRRFGLGQMLFDAFVEVAKEKEAALVKWQVLDWNEPAVNFYKKNNATIEKEWWNGKIIF